MTHRMRLGLWAAAGALALTGASAHATESSFEYGRFGHLTVYTPARPPDSVALFVSGDGGWNLGVTDMARTLNDMGALVVGIDIRSYLGSVARSTDSCVSMAGDFENLSHAVQKQYNLPRYHVPIAVGYSSGATLIYALLAQAPVGTLAGGLSLGFSPDLMVGSTLCKGEDLHYSTGKKGEFIFDPATKMRTPWIAMQGEIDQVVSPALTASYVTKTPGASLVSLPHVGHGYSKPANWEGQYRQSYGRLAALAEPDAPVASNVDDLPLVEIPAKAAATHDAGLESDLVAVLLTGDGGWAGLDQDVSAELAAHGVPVVGFNSLKYFWRARTQQETAEAVARATQHALDRFGKARVAFIGYSFGADVLPFTVNRLPADLVARTASVNLLGLSKNADFEIKVANWLPNAAAATRGEPVAPEIARLSSSIPVQCFYGDGEKHDPCTSLPSGRVQQVQIGAGHHFSGDAAGLVAAILKLSAKGDPVARR